MESFFIDGWTPKERKAPIPREWVLGDVCLDILDCDAVQNDPACAVLNPDLEK